jgi:hypothetical protein
VTATDIIAAKVLLSAAWSVFPFIVMFASGPPRHESWWYPNPDRWHYRPKLILYAVLDANTPSDPAARWFVRVIAVGVLVGGVVTIWLWQPCSQPCVPAD